MSIHDHSTAGAPASPPATATLTAKDFYGGRHLSLDCRHGTTGAWFSDDAATAAGPVTDADIVPRLLLSHWLHEDCDCARPLWVRFGMEAEFDGAIAEVTAEDLRERQGVRR